ncbi:MAG: class I tRNA ligase family protein, partial [Methanospirillum sp.]|nr:class I tRNA ligase family protein [Methanospirillum sp.]
ADNYIEMVKGRLYSDSLDRDGACVAIRTSLNAVCRMLAPFTPYFAEEVWSFMEESSVHQEPWVSFSYEDEEAALSGEILVQVISEIRRYKHDKGLALNAPLGEVTVYTPVHVDDAGDGGMATNCSLTWKTGMPELTQVVSGVKFDMGIIGPKLRGKAKGFMQAVEALPKESLVTVPPMVIIDGEEIAVPEGSVLPQLSYTVAGASVDLIPVSDNLVITINQ